MPSERRSCRRLLLPLLLAIAGFAAFAIDVPVATSFRQWNSPRHQTVTDYLGYLNTFEPFGHGLGVVFVLFVLHQLARNRRWALPRVLACALAAGGAADLLKMLVIRTRPYNLAVDFHGTVWATFGQWFPLLGGESGTQSFPSAHTATACGLAAALIWLYPNGRLLFTSLAVLVGCQRVVACAHYPSDVLFGAATGCLVAVLLLHVGRLPPLFDRWESPWRKK